jgi:polar amino acid transport system substrate-binding protein
MHELGSRLGVPVEFVLFETPGDVADAAETNTWDVAILAIEPARAEKVAFSPPITEIEATYAVHADSALNRGGAGRCRGHSHRRPGESGIRAFLTRTLRHATLIRTKNFRRSIDCFNQRRADALSGLKPALLESMDKLPDARLLEGTFMTVNHGLATPRARNVAAAYLKSFVEDVNASGFVARSIARHGVKGLSAVK